MSQMITETITGELNGAVLTISGEGIIPDYENSSDLPWVNEKNSITKVIIKDGITRIGSRTFADCSMVESISISNTVKCIGLSAFSGCTSLLSITLPDVSTIEIAAFYNCSSLKKIKACKRQSLKNCTDLH